MRVCGSWDARAHVTRKLSARRAIKAAEGRCRPRRSCGAQYFHCLPSFRSYTTGMTTARASVLEQFKAPLQLRHFALPAKLEPGAALVRTEMAGICGTDVHLWKGELPIALPVILGHETVGVIEKLGAGLTRDWSGEPLRVGDRVTWTSAT